MLQSDIATWLKFALQQMAAESYLNDIDLNNPEEVVPRLLLGNNRVGFLEKGFTRFTGTLSQGQARDFFQRYQIVDHHANDATGFSATLMLDRTTGEYTLSFRSLEYQSQAEGGDWERDGQGGAAGEIAGSGFALGQLVSMERYYLDLKSSGRLPAGATLNISGYSLGGHLATVFTILHADEINHTYIFNGAGIGKVGGVTPVLTEEIRIKQLIDAMDAKFVEFDPLGNLTRSGSTANVQTLSWYQSAVIQVAGEFQTIGTASFPMGGMGGGITRTEGVFSKITQLFGTSATGGDLQIVANSGVHGPVQSVLIEGQPLLESLPSLRDYGNAHSITLIVDSLALQELFQTIDPTLTQTEIETIFKASSGAEADALATPNEAHTAEGDTLEKALDGLRKVFIDAGAPATDFNDDTGGFGRLELRNEFYSHLAEVKAQLTGRFPGQTFRIASLVGQSAKDIQAAAEAEGPRSLAYRFALKELTPFVVLGDDSATTQQLYDQQSESGQLSLVNPDTGVGELTQQYLIDRVVFLTVKILANTNESSVLNTTHFHDNGSGYDITPLPGFTRRHMLFGGDTGEILAGGMGSDHLYGGSGDDELHGMGNVDYLEGNSGDDILDGGGGADTLVGGSGNDTYIVDDVGDVAREYANSGIDEVRSSVTFTLDSQVENLTLGGSADIDGVGNELDNLLVGNSGANRLVGKGGRDTLQGGNGADVLLGGTDDDLLEGGSGFDTYYYNDGDGTDQIEDSDASGRIIFNGKILLGGVRKAGDAPDTYRSLDDVFMYVMSEGHLIVNGVLTVNADFQNGQFGIELIDRSDDSSGELPHNNYENGQQTVTWIGDNADNEPSLTAPMNHVAHGLGGNDFLDFTSGAALYNHQIFGEAGHDALYGGEGHDRIFGGEGIDLIRGWGGNDVLFGGDDFDVMHGNAGNDYIDGENGNDEINGDDGDDIIYGGNGDDFLAAARYGEVEPGAEADYVNGGAGNDYVWAGPGDDVLIGEEGDDILHGDNITADQPPHLRVDFPGIVSVAVSYIHIDPVGGADYLDGGPGVDTLYGEGGDDILIGGEGDDVLYGDDQNIAQIREGDDLLDGGDGADLLVGGGGADILIGGDGADELIGDYVEATGANEAEDILDGGAGDDILLGGGGDDQLYGGSEHDTLVGQDGNDFLDGGEGTDLLLGGLGDDTLFGGEGNDLLIGEEGSDIISGDEGDDEVQGGEGNDLIAGDAGHDRLFGDEGSDQLFGDDGNDTLIGGDQDDVLAGGAGYDVLVGQKGDDELIGGSGRDSYLFEVGDGHDTIADAIRSGEENVLQFGDGITLQSLAFLHDSLQQTLTIHVSDGDSITLLGFDPNTFEYVIDTLIFSDGLQVSLADQLPLPGGILEGSDESNIIHASPGDDVIFAGNGNDSVNGGAGDDLILGEGGNDLLAGGLGQDTYVFNIGDGTDTLFDMAGEGNRIAFGAGIQPDDITLGRADGGQLEIRGHLLQDRLVVVGGLMDGGPPIETFQFADGTILTFDQLVARGIDIAGTAGSDFIIGTSFIDRISGGEGADLIHGGDGDDVLTGEAGSDSLEGQLGDDVLVGGTGDDQLFGGAGNDTYRFNLGDGVDSITDTIDGDDSNRVLFGAGITAASVSLTTNAGQVMVRPGPAFEGMMVGATSDDPLGFHAIDLFEFADGTTLTYAELVARGFDIDGTESDDILFGTNVVDRFRGGLGNDLLGGGEGNDSYFFNLGDGLDTIVDIADSGADNDLIFGAGIASNDLHLDLTADKSDPSLSDLLIRVGMDGDAVQIDTFDRDNVLESRGVESFRFADGSTLAYDQLLARGFDITGTEGDDQINATNVVDRVQAGDGSDVIKTGLGDDQLDGGPGNDRLIGGQGNDTYVFGSGSGHDTIVEFQGSHDRIRMAAGVAPSDVIVSREGQDLVLSLNGEADRLTVSMHFLAPPLQIESIQFADGTVWDHAAIDSLTRPAITGTGGQDVLVGTNGDDRLAGLGGDDELTGLAGNDQLDGGTGADLLTGGVGDDLYVVGDAGDVVIELADEGIDTIQSSVTRALELHVERLVLTGTGAINGTGNELDNVLIGNPGANVLAGGKGNDTYVIGAGDTVIELTGEGTDSVQADVGATLPANVENLVLVGSASLVGTGNELDNLLQADGSISVLTGGAGNDTYLLGANGDDDILVETDGGGIDTVIVSHDYRLPAHIENLTLRDPRVLDFGSFSFMLHGPSDQAVMGHGNELANTLTGGRASNVLDGGPGIDTLIGGAGDDTYLVDEASDSVIEQMNEGTDSVRSSATYSLSSNVENLTLLGTAPINGTGNALNNDIRGNEAANVLDGGEGDDSLMGFGGADTYLFGRGSGRDFVFDSGVAGEIDEIQMMPDINPGDVEVYRRGYDLVLAVSGTADEITLASFYDSAGYDQKIVRFADGTVWNDAELHTRAQSVGASLTGTPDDDTLLGSAGHDVLVGFEGHDMLAGGLGNDWLYGDAVHQMPFGPQIIGNDTLVGGGGDDVLIDLRGTNLFDGGPGNDQLFVGTGQDSIVFGHGSGDDIVTLDTNESDLDVIQMAADVSPSDVVLTRSVQRGTGTNIIELAIPSTGDRLTLNMSYTGPTSETNPQAAVQFTDGTRWDLVWAPLAQGSSGRDVLESAFPGAVAGLEGDDTYLLGSSGVPGTYTVIEEPGGGIDTVQSRFSYILDAHVENLVLGERNSSALPPAERGTGNDLDNVIIGNTGDNILDGGAGDDVLIGGIFLELEGPPYFSATGSDILIGGPGDDVLMEDAGNLSFTGGLFLDNGLDRIENPPRVADDLLIGGPGNDTYIVHSQQQTIAEFENEGIDTVRSTVSYVLGEQLENLVLISPTLDEEDGIPNPALPLDGTGNDLDNVLLGSEGANFLTGLDGRDTLVGGRGDDTLRGGAGHDTYLFNLGDGIDMIEDAVTFGEGNRLQFGAGITRNDLAVAHDTIARTLSIQVGAEGTDKLFLTSFDPAGTAGTLVIETLAFSDGSEVSLASLLGPTMTIFGSDNADVLVGTAANDGIDAGAGNDIVYANGGNDLVLGGTGDDVASGDDGDDTLFGGTGTDYLYGGSGNDVIYGDEGNDVMMGDAGNDVLHGGLGNDVLHGGTGADEFFGGDGDDSIYMDAADTIIDAGAGYDSVTFQGLEAVTLDATAAQVELASGSSGNDVLDATGSLASVTFYGGEGDDRLVGGDGNDVLLGQAGDDTLTGGLGNDVLNGGEGADVLAGEAGHDTFYAGSGDDLITGGDGNDSVSGEAGADTIAGGSGTDYLYGGDGDDIINGDDGDDIVVGEVGNDVLSGGAGNDVLQGGVGADQLNGGDGDDSLYIDASDTVVSGGAGYDVAIVVSSEDVHLDAGAAQLELVAGGSGHDLFTAIESLWAVTFYGGEGDDQLIGGHANDVLIGQGGNDALTGGLGDDVLNGGDGHDVLNGQQGNDAMYGGAGNDWLQGHEGTDSLSGEQGSDVLLGGADSDYLYGGEGNDLLDGGSGNDVLVGDEGIDELFGAEGHDYLVGGHGSDTYHFGRGGGSDTVAENDSAAGNNDTLMFDSGVDPLDLIVSRQANNLRLLIHGTGDEVLIENWYESEARQVETIQAGNGEVLLNGQVDQLIQAMAGFSQQTGLTWEQGVEQRPQEVQAVLAANWH